MTAQTTTSEARRLKVLWQYDVLDTVPEELFDDLTELAARICEAPIALIRLRACWLVLTQRRRFKRLFQKNGRQRLALHVRGVFVCE